MTKYLVFHNPDSTQHKNKSGSPEHIACHIASIAQGHGTSSARYIAFPDSSPDATFFTIQALPKFSIELDKERIGVWTREVMPIRIKMDGVYEAIGDAFSNLSSALEDLAQRCECTENFADIDMTPDMDIDQAFQYLQHPNEYDFRVKVLELFEVQYLQHAYD